MNQTTQTIQLIESRIENALHELEMDDKLDEAFVIYQQCEQELNRLEIRMDDPTYREQQRVLSYCLMREGNILRQQGKPEEANAFSNKELVAARRSGDGITLARALMSVGTNLIVAGQVDEGLQHIDEAAERFKTGDSYDHRLGLGRCTILLADLANAGLIKKELDEVVKIATEAMEILEPLENWPGVARAYAARAAAREKLGDQAEASMDRDKQAIAQAKIGAKDN